MLESRIRDLLLAIREEAVRQGTDTEFWFHREHSSLIRLGNSAVALSTHEDLSRLDILVQDGRRTGAYTMTADVTSIEQLRAALGRARESCAAALPKDYDPIFGVVEQALDDSRGYDPRLEAMAPEAKTDLCARVVKAIKPSGNYDFSGSWSSGATELYCLTTANTKEAYRRLTDGRLVLVLKEQDKKWELSVEQGGKDVSAFSAEAAIAEFDSLLPVYEKNPGFKTALGNQRVVFGTQAVASLVQLAIWSGFIGRSWEEKRSFTAKNQLGDKLFSEQITISDDPTNPNVFGMPFDGKGMARRPFPLVENGTFRGLIYDSATAAKYGRKPTGHDCESSDVVLAPGQAPARIEDALKLAGEAVYIPHLHYIHLPNPSVGMFTGSSRFNARRIAGEAFTAPLLSTRVTDTIPNVLSNVAAIASRPVLFNVSATYGRRSPEAVSVPEYMICDNVRISDVADSF